MDRNDQDTQDRYAGIADWYDATFGGYRDGPSARAIRDMLGPGHGMCLDLGCGGGLHFDEELSTGRTVIGTDLSGDQLRVAARRGCPLVQADAARLPFRSGSLDTVASTFTHTDLPDFAGALGEAARVLGPGGVLVYVGTHPCFVNYAAERGTSEVIVGEDYSEAGWRGDSPVFRPEGLRSRVGEFHLPLGEFLMAFIDCGLHLTEVREMSGGFGSGLTSSAPALPGLIAVAAVKGCYAPGSPSNREGSR